MPLASLAQLRLRVGITDATVTSEDALLAQILDGVTAGLEAETRPLMYAGADLTEYYDGGCQQILLNSWPVTSVVSIKESADHDWANVDALVLEEDYYLNRERGRLLRRPRGATWEEGEDSVQAILRTGFLTPGATPVSGVSEAPTNFQEACLLLSLYYYKRRDSLGLGWAAAGGNSISGITDRELWAYISNVLLSGESRL